MKKYLILLIALIVCVAWAADETTMNLNTTNLSQKCADIQVLELYDNEEDASDTMATSTRKVSGPYSLTKGTGEPKYSSVNIRHQPITGTTPTCDLMYQVTHRRALNDTMTAGWVSIDTMDATGGNVTVDLSSLNANFIYFKIDNYDGTTSIISDYVTAAFLKNIGFNHNKRE